MDITKEISLAKKHTCLPIARLRSVAKHIQTCIDENIPGCFIECGVQMGGTVCFLKLIANKLGATDREVHGFDSFEGLPVPSIKDVAVDGTNAYTMYQNNRIFEDCVVSVERFNHTVKDLGVEGQVIGHKGWFKDTLPVFEKQIAILRADGDWYESTSDILKNLYDKVVPGGFIIFDDYNYWKGCHQAVDEFLQQRQIQVQMHFTDSEEMWFRKPWN